MTIAIIDYGMGNLRSVSKACEAVGASATVTSDPQTIRSADKVILPGVGAFSAAMAELRSHGLDLAVREAVESGKPYLGICLGLQLLFDSSEEAPGEEGLGILPGTVRRFPEGELKVPHMGWNQVNPASVEAAACPLLKGIEGRSFFYFVHTFFAEPKQDNDSALKTTYGVEFTSMVWKDALFATQFHPEKSQQLGLKLLTNFVEL